MGAKNAQKRIVWIAFAIWHVYTLTASIFVFGGAHVFLAS